MSRGSTTLRCFSTTPRKEMWSSSRQRNRVRTQALPFVLLAVLFACSPHRPSGAVQGVESGAATQAAPVAIKVDTVATFSKAKWEMTRAYALENYGVNSARLDSPRMVVIHYTVIP